MTQTRQQLLENFDEEVHEKLRVNLENSRTYLKRYERLLMQVTQFELDGHAEFLEGESAFSLHSCPFPETEGIPLGLYELPRRSGEAHLYRLGHPLAVQVLDKAKSRVLPPAEVIFDYAGYGVRIAALEPYFGQRGELLLSLFTVESLDQAEDYLLFTAVNAGGEVLDEDTARRLLSLPASSVAPLPAPLLNEKLQTQAEKGKTDIQRSISERNARFF
jgi:hypothetical protein